MWRPVLLSAQWVGFFNIESGIGKNTGFRSGRSVEIYDRLFSGIFFTLRYFQVFLGISGHMGYHLFFQGSEPNIEVIFFHLLRVFFKATTQDCRGVIPEIHSHVWEYTKHQVITKTSG